MKNIIIFLLLITICCSCSHSANPDVTVDNSNKSEDSIVTPAPQVLTRDFRKDVIIALYMMGCNDRLEMGLPDEYEEDPWGFYFIIDSLVDTQDYFSKIESNLAQDRYHYDLQDSINRWLFLSRMFDLPIECNLTIPEYGDIDELPQTHHLLDKYINRDIQGVESLSSSQQICYYIDILKCIFSLPCDDQMQFIIDYYTYIRDHPKDFD